MAVPCFKGHLGCFQFEAIVNKATINVCMQVYEKKCLFLEGKCLAVGFLAPAVSVCLIVEDTAALFSHQ